MAAFKRNFFRKLEHLFQEAIGEGLRESDNSSHHIDGVILMDLAGRP
jgi:hypothetical protein